MKEMARRHELTQAEWERIEPFLPARNRGQGRPGKDIRQIINAILWILSTGAPWRDLPEHYGPWKSVYNRYREWTKAGVWTRVYEALLENIPTTNATEWVVWQIDSTTCKVHQHAAGGKGGLNPNASDDPEAE